MKELNDAIVVFIKQTLGCACPDEVFRKIRTSPLVISEEETGMKINIGDRLLVYIIPFTAGADPLNLIYELADAGIKERDDKRFNRFRLALAVPEPEAIKKAAQERFAAIRQSNEKAHLHVVDINGSLVKSILDKY